MRKALGAVLVATVFLLGNAAIVTAGDFCLSHSSGDTLVLKAFSLPGKGVCKETRGFYSGAVYFVTGMACGSSDLDHVTFFHTAVSQDGGQVFTDRFSLSRTTLSGSGKGCELDTGFGGSCGLATWTKVDCSPKTVPVP